MQKAKSFSDFVVEQTREKHANKRRRISRAVNQMGSQHSRCSNDATKFPSFWSATTNLLTPPTPISCALRSVPVADLRGRGGEIIPPLPHSASSSVAEIALHDLIQPT